MDLYEKFAYDYDEFGPIDEYLGDEKDFFDQLFSAHKIKTVLDCACGTGQHLYLLRELGYQVWGSDYSASMLKVAENNLKQRNQTTALCQCDFRHFI